MLDARSIIAEAEDHVGQSDTDLSVGTNLEHLVSSILHEGQQSETGLARTKGMFLRDTVARLEGLKWINQHPEIAEEKIEAPIFLTGLPRSGTTYFQYLFDRDTRFRLIRTWESLMPSPPPGSDPASVDARRQKWIEIQQQRSDAPKDFAAMHLVDADGSDECHAFMEQSFGAAGLNNLHRAPSFFNYLITEANFEEIYRIHKRQLQLLQWRSPTKPWALKYPNHTLAMDTIVKVYPDARFVMTHRDPVQTLASLCKLTAALRGVGQEGSVDKHQVGQDMAYFVERHIERIMAFDAGPDSSRVTHVDYYDLAADPVSKLHTIHAALGMDTPETLSAEVQAWHRDNPKNARGSNDYALEEYGLRDDEMAERFSTYRRRFDIPREREGLARTGAIA